MYSMDRKMEILNILKKDNKVEVNYLSNLFNTSKETIRRDLKKLEIDGFVKRTHGGAVANKNIYETEFPIIIRKNQNSDEKNIICMEAAKFIEDKDVIFIDNSSTTQNLIKYIDKSKNVTIITNSIQVLLESVNCDNNNLSIICLGGIFKKVSLSIYGSISEENSRKFHPDKSFISCQGIHESEQITDGSLYEVDTKKLMLSLSKKKFLLADSSKFSHIGQVALSDFDSIDYIITDKNVDTTNLEYLNKYNLELIVCS